MARGRIAAGLRPGWFAAWAPVGFDALCLVVIIALLFGPFQRLTDAFALPVWVTVVALLALCFIPVQGVLILSSLWAAKSRWTDEEK